MRSRFIGAALAIVALAALLAIVILPVSAAASGTTVLVDDTFTGGLTSTKEANNKGDGSWGSQSDMITVTGADGGKYGVFFPTMSGSNPAHSFMSTSWTHTYFRETDDVRYFIYELDLATETQYTSGIHFEMISRIVASGKTTGNFVKYLTVNETANGTVFDSNGKTLPAEGERGAWQHITFVVDAKRNNASGTGSKSSTVYIYINGKLLDTKPAFGTKDITYIESMRFSIAQGTAIETTDTMCVDNVRVTKLTDAYSGNLAAVLADPARSIADADCTAYTDSYVFPKTRPIASIGDKTYSTVSEIEAALQKGDTLTVLSHIRDTLTIPCDMAIYNPDGYSVSYDKGGFDEYVDGSTVTFIGQFEPIDVIFHLGDKTETVTYTSPKAITPPEYGGTVDIGGIPCLAVGFAREEGGEVLADLGYPTEYNREFWLVYEAPSAYALHTGGTRTYIYGDAQLSGAIRNAASGDVITLMSDSTLCTDSTNGYTVRSRSLTIDLAGYTLRLADGCTTDVFTVGSGGSLTLKGGHVLMLNNGRIPATSTSNTLVKNRIFVTETGAYDASITAERLTIDVCKMLAIVKAGTCSFTDCDIDFTHDYENMIDLYPSADSTPTALNMTRCRVKAFKTIVNTFKPSSISSSDTRITFTDCDMRTDERIITLESLGSASISGGSYTCQYLFGKENANTASFAILGEGTRLNYTAIAEFPASAPKIELEDRAIVRCGKANEYIVTAEYANVSWQLGSLSQTESWQKGATPICPFALPEDTRAIKYDTPTPVPVTEDATYVIVARPNFSVKVRLVLETNLSLNIYIPEIDFTSVRVGKTAYAQRNCTPVLLDGVPHYKFNTGAISPATAADTFKFTVSAVGHTGNVSFSTTVSLTEYVERLLAEAPDTASYRLALSVINYIGVAAGENAPDSLKSIIARYRTDSVRLGTPESTLGNELDGAISEVLLGTDGINAVRLKFNSGYTGELTLTYTAGGRSCTESISVKAGKVRGCDYIDIFTDATALSDGITVSTGSAEATVTVADCKTDNTALRDALYTYARCVRAYLDRK